MKNQNEIEKEKPKGWANLQQQLKEVREESFKQGIWKGKEIKEKEMLDEFKKMIEEMDFDFLYSSQVEDVKKELKQKLEKLK